MKITKNQLKQIIKEELGAVLSENTAITAATVSDPVVKKLVEDALTSADLPVDTELVGYAEHGVDVTLIPRDPKLDATKWTPGSNVHTGLATIKGRELEAAGVISASFKQLGLEKQQIHTPAGWME